MNNIIICPESAVKDYLRDTNPMIQMPDNPNKIINVDDRFVFNRIFQIESMLKMENIFYRYLFFIRGLLDYFLWNKYENKIIEDMSLFKDFRIFDNKIRELINQGSKDNRTPLREAGKIAETYLSAGSISKKLIEENYLPEHYEITLRNLKFFLKEDYADNNEVYEFKTPSKKENIIYSFREALYQTNLYCFLGNKTLYKTKFRKLFKRKIVIEIFDASENKIYQYILKPDYKLAEAILNFKGINDINSFFDYPKFEIIEVFKNAPQTQTNIK